MSLPHSLPRARGFSLVETLTAVTLFGSVLAGLALSLLTTAETNAQARRLSAATVLAETRLESLRAAGFAALVPGTTADPLNPLDERGVTGGTYRRSWTVEAGPAPGTATVTVAVAWSDKAGAHVVEIPTVVAP
jgi:prepilin-type N-terminal cleavage/methylation domain-containing protein